TESEGDSARSESAVAEPAGPPPRMMTSHDFSASSSVLADSVKRCDDTGRGYAAIRRMRHGANNRADYRGPLQIRIAVWPDRHEPANVIINPLFARYQSPALKANLHRRTIAART